MNIQAKLKELGFESVPESFYAMLQVWDSWYKGSVKDFHCYTVFNGMEEKEFWRYSAGMGKKVCEDWASLLLNEKVKITLEGEKEQLFVDEVFADNNFRVKANESQERKAATGTAAYVVSVEGMTVAEGSGEILRPGKMRINYCSAAGIYPLTWDNGRVVECAFVSNKSIDDKQYTYLQLHRLNGGLYDVENRLYCAGEAVPLTGVRGFEGVPEILHTGSDKPLFVIDRMNIANTDEDNPMGVSVLAHAIDQLKGVDIAYDGYVNEFVLGKKRIIVQPSATKDLHGRPIFDARETVYYVLPEDMQDSNILQQVDMSLRTSEFNAGMQDMLNMLSSKCGLGERYYRFDGGSIATATQVISEHSSLFRNIKKHEIILEAALVELCRTILRVGNRYMDAGLDEDVEISIDFDDSIIEDKSQDFARDLQLLNAGILNDWEFRATWLNEDADTAKASLPRMQDMVDEDEAEVE